MVNGSEPNGIVIMDIMWKWKNIKILTDPFPILGFYRVVVSEEKVCPRSRRLK